MYMYMYMWVCVHVLMEERIKQGQTNKAKQHSKPKATTFPKKNELLRVGLKPTCTFMNYFYRPYATVNISCGLLEAVLSRSVVDLAHRVLQTVRDAIVREERGEGRQGDAVRGAIVREERGEGRQGEAVPGDYLKGVESGVEREGPTEEVVHFRDDLRTGDFVYVTDSEGNVYTCSEPLRFCLYIYTYVM